MVAIDVTITAAAPTSRAAVAVAETLFHASRQLANLPLPFAEKVYLFENALDLTPAFAPVGDLIEYGDVVDQRIHTELRKQAEFLRQVADFASRLQPLFAVG